MRFWFRVLYIVVTVCDVVSFLEVPDCIVQRHTDNQDSAMTP